MDCVRKIDLSALERLSQEKGEPQEAISAPEVPPRLTQAVRERRQLMQAYRAQQEAIRRSEDLRAMILQGLADDMESDLLLRLSLECIGVMLGDASFTQQALASLDAREEQDKA